MAEAGKRDRLVTIQEIVESKGSSNYPVETPSNLAQVWASMKQTDGSERFIAEQHSAPFDTTWDVPYSAQWDPALLNVPKARRIVWNSRVYDIVAAEEIGRKQGVRLMTLSGGTVV